MAHGGRLRNRFGAARDRTSRSIWRPWRDRTAARRPRAPPRRSPMAGRTSWVGATAAALARDAEFSLTRGIGWRIPGPAPRASRAAAWGGWILRNRRTPSVSTPIPHGSRSTTRHLAALAPAPPRRYAGGRARAAPPPHRLGRWRGPPHDPYRLPYDVRRHRWSRLPTCRRRVTGSVVAGADASGRGRRPVPDPPERRVESLKPWRYSLNEPCVWAWIRRPASEPFPVGACAGSLHRGIGGMPYVYTFEQCPFRDMAHAVADWAPRATHGSRRVAIGLPRQRAEISDEARRLSLVGQTRLADEVSHRLRADAARPRCPHSRHRRAHRRRAICPSRLRRAERRVSPHRPRRPLEPSTAAGCAGAMSAPERRRSASASANARMPPRRVSRGEPRPPQRRLS